MEVLQVVVLERVLVGEAALALDALERTHVEVVGLDVLFEVVTSAEETAAVIVGTLVRAHYKAWLPIKMRNNGFPGLQEE